jgi:hypothetical protein
VAVSGYPPPYGTLGDIPGGEYNLLATFRDEYAALTGYSVDVPDWALLMMANQGVMTLRDFGQSLAQFRRQQGAPAINFPWADVGLTKDEYAATADIYATTYKKVTGQDISPEALQQAFQSPQASSLLTGSQYQQQLMNDLNIQKTYGWVKYGLDFSAWTQQKLQMRSAFGRDIRDAEAATMLQYTKSASGPSMSAQARTQGQQQQTPAGVGGSIAR